MKLSDQKPGTFKDAGDMAGTSRIVTCKHHCRSYWCCDTAKKLALQGLDIPCHNLWLKPRKDIEQSIRDEKRIVKEINNIKGEK